MKRKYSLLSLPFVRYGLSIVAVIGAFILYEALVRLAGGALPTYITFYPAVMLVALLAGVRAGLLATAMAVIAAAFWILPPEGFAVSSIPDAVGLAIFFFNGAFLSLVAELYRRARQKSATYEAELALLDEREKAQEALLESEKRFRALFESIQEGFYLGEIIWGKDGEPEDYTYADVNPAFEQIMALNREQIIGKRLKELTPEVSSEWLDIFTQVASTGEPVNVEFYSEAFERHFKAVAYSPSKEQFAVLLEDISERKKAEEKIQLQNRVLEGINRIFERAISCETEEELGDLCLEVVEALTGSKIGFIGEIGADGRLYDIAISNPGWKLCSMRDRSGHADSLKFEIHGLYGRVLADGVSLLVNKPDAHPDCVGIPPGHPPLTAFLGVPLIQRGKTIGMIGLGNRPGGYTTEHQQIAETLAPAILQVLLKKRAEAEIHALTLRLSYHMKHSPLAVIEWGPDMRLTRWAGEAENMFGWRAEEVINKRMEDFKWIYQEDEALVLEVSNALQSGSDFRRFSSNRNYRKDGSIIHCDWYSTSMLDKQGNLLSILSFVLDVTERKRFESALEKRTKQLEEANRELESFSYSVSHDLRAPLRAIDGFSRMIARELKDKLDDEQNRKLRVIRENAQQMGHLIDDLLAFSRLGRQALSLFSIDMKKMVNQVWEECSVISFGRKIELKIGELPEAFGDHGLIKQALMNLVSNAIKFTAPKGEAVIEITGRQEAKEVLYSIKDNGVGFDMRYKDKLFGVFQRLHSADEFEGTGVGLALVQRIVHRHGGRVWAEGKEGEGAIFYFTLPCAESEKTGQVNET